MGTPPPAHRPHDRPVVARDRLPHGVVVSTVRLPGPRSRYETTVFAAGWPDRPDADEVETRRTTSREAALDAHRALVARHAPAVDPADPDWVFKLLGLPPRRAHDPAKAVERPRPDT
ncbi:MAG: hypothetical protein KF878_01370 [Planctomycetes bacterium]|nr:hypothetical protein [Planctomycetota bacterium]